MLRHRSLTSNLVARKKKAREERRKLSSNRTSRGQRRIELQGVFSRPKRCCRPRISIDHRATTSKIGAPEAVNQRANLSTKAGAGCATDKQKKQQKFQRSTDRKEVPKVKIQIKEFRVRLWVKGLPRTLKPALESPYILLHWLFFTLVTKRPSGHSEGKEETPKEGTS